MPYVIALHLGHQRRPRSSEAHVATQHVPQLRQLVERGPAQPPADARHAGIGGQLERVAANLVQLHELGQAILRAVVHRPELQHLERAPVKSDAPLLEQRSSRRVLADRQREDQHQRREQHDQRSGPNDVEQTLGDERDDPIRTGDDRVDWEPFELLHAAGRKGVLEHVHRDPDDLPLLLAQARDRVDMRRLRDRKADRDLVDDVGVEDLLDVVDGPEDRPAHRPGLTVGSEMPDDAQAELVVRLDHVGELLRSSARAEDQDEPRVSAALSQPDQHRAKGQPRQQRAQCEPGEQEQQYGTADIRQLEDEEQAQQDGGEQRRGTQDVEDLSAQGEPNARSIQALAPQCHRPRHRIQGERADRVRDHRHERGEGVRWTEPEDAGEAQHCDRRDCVEQRQEQAQLSRVASDHSVRSSQPVGAPGNRPGTF